MALPVLGLGLLSGVSAEVGRWLTQKIVGDAPTPAQLSPQLEALTQLISQEVEAGHPAPSSQVSRALYQVPGAPALATELSQLYPRWQRDLSSRQVPNLNRGIAANQQLVQDVTQPTFATGVDGALSQEASPQQLAIQGLSGIQPAITSTRPGLEQASAPGAQNSQNVFQGQTQIDKQSFNNLLQHISNQKGMMDQLSSKISSLERGQLMTPSVAEGAQLMNNNLGILFDRVSSNNRQLEANQLEQANQLAIMGNRQQQLEYHGQSSSGQLRTLEDRLNLGERRLEPVINGLLQSIHPTRHQASTNPLPGQGLALPPAYGQGMINAIESGHNSMVLREPQTENNQGGNPLVHRRQRPAQRAIPYQPVNADGMSTAGQAAYSLNPTREGTAALRQVAGYGAAALTGLAARTLSDAANSTIEHVGSKVARYAFNKITGDAPVATTYNMHATKVVGDAPTVQKVIGDEPIPANNEKVVGEDIQAGVSSLSSATGVLQSKAVLAEQTLATTYAIEARDYDTLMRGIINVLDSANGSFMGQPVELGIRLAGAAWWPLNMPYDSSTSAHPAYQHPMISHRVEPKPALVAPPMLISSTLSNLAMLEKNAEITTFSSTSRIKMTSFDADALSAIWRNIEAQVMGQTGYDFTPPLLKLLLTLTALYPIPGNEMAEFISGIAYASPSLGQLYNKAAEAGAPFPYHHYQTKEERASPTAFRICGWDEFVARASNRSERVWDHEWDLNTWNNTTAVVYYRADESTMSDEMLVRALSNMQYPFMNMAAEPTVYVWHGKDGWVVTNPLAFAWPPTLIPSANLVYLPGPTDRVLFVNVTYKHKQAPSVILPGNTVVSAALNAPFGPQQANQTLNLYNIFISWLNEPGDLTIALSHEITNWEKTFGNASDMAMAFRMSAIFSAHYRQKPVWVRAKPNTAEKDQWINFFVCKQATMPPDYQGVSTFDAGSDITDGIFALATDSVGEFGHITPWTSNLPAADRSGQIGPKPSYLIGGQDVMIDFSVYFDLLRPSEEMMPASYGANVMRTVLSIREAGVIWACIGDMLHQNSETTLTERLTNSVAMPDPRSTKSQIKPHMDIQLEADTQALLKAGVQFGHIESSVYESGNEYCTDIWNSFGLSEDVHGPMSFVRVPTYTANFYNPPLCITSPEVTFSGLDAQLGLLARRYVTRGRQKKWEHQVIDAATFVCAGGITNEFLNCRRLSLTEMPGVASLNPYLWVYKERENSLVRFLFQMEMPDANLQFVLAYANFNEGFTLTGQHAFKSTPIAYQHPQGDIVQATNTMIAYFSADAVRETFIHSTTNVIKMLIMFKSAASLIQTDMPPIATLGRFFRPSNS
jgi:hypothetical protein